jgi:hypothetical protein
LTVLLKDKFWFVPLLETSLKKWVMKWIVYTLKKMVAMIADWPGKVLHRKGEMDSVWKDGFNYVHPYDPFFPALQKKKRVSKVKLDEFEISAFHDGQ